MVDQPQRPAEAQQSSPQEAVPANMSLWPTGWGWSRRNLVALAALLTVLAALVGWRTWHNRAYLGAELEVLDSRLAPVGEKIDPNSASWASLARLPGLGQAKAKSVVEYRQQWAREHPHQPAFSTASDLQRVPGIGPIIVQQISPFLTFLKEPGTQP